MPVVYKVLLGTLGPPIRLFGRVRAIGRKRVPQGAAVLVFNHPRNIDPFNLVAAWNGILTFLGKKEAFEIPVIGFILRDLVGHIPLDRQKGNNVAAIEEAVAHLRSGHKIALAPEGTKQKGNALGRGRTGAVRLALAADAPIVPAAITYGSGPLGACTVEFGEPIDLSRWAGGADDLKACREATDQVMTVLAAMLGQPDYDPATAPDYAAAKGFRKPKATENPPEF